MLKKYRAEHFSTHEILKHIDMIRIIIWMCFVCSSWYFNNKKEMLTNYSQCGVINHTKSACLAIIESKSTIDHSQKTLQAGFKWVLSKYINNYMQIVPLMIF